MLQEDITKQTGLRFLWRRSLWHGDEGGHGLDAVPEDSGAEFFAGGVLRWAFCDQTAKGSAQDDKFNFD
jgi:hypothetical protein